MPKLTLSTVGSRYGSIDALNANFDAIEQAIENTLSLDGTTPNEMQADLNMGGNDLLNVGSINGENVSTFTGSITTVAGNMANINAVAANNANVTTVATNISNVNNVGGNISNINTVAGVSADVTAVAADLPNLNIKVPRTSATGSAVVPTGSTGQRDGTPLTGYFRFNTTTTKFEGYNGTAWGSVGGGATGGGADEVFIENGQAVTTNYSMASGRNAVTTGPITINSGVSVTIPSGSRWVIL